MLIAAPCSEQLPAFNLYMDDTWIKHCEQPSRAANIIWLSMINQQKRDEMFWWFCVTFIKERIWKNDKSLTIFCDDSPIQFPSFTSWDRLVGNLEETHVTSRLICWVKHDKFQGIYEGNDKSGKKGTDFFKAKLRGLGFDIRSTQVKSNLLDDLHSKAHIRHTFPNKGTFTGSISTNLQWFHFDQVLVVSNAPSAPSCYNHRLPVPRGSWGCSREAWPRSQMVGQAKGPRVPGDMLGSRQFVERETWW